MAIKGVKVKKWKWIFGSKKDCIAIVYLLIFCFTCNAILFSRQWVNFFLDRRYLLPVHCCLRIKSNDYHGASFSRKVLVVFHLSSMTYSKMPAKRFVETTGLHLRGTQCIWFHNMTLLWSHLISLDLWLETVAESWRVKTNTCNMSCPLFESNDIFHILHNSTST